MLLWIRRIVAGLVLVFFTLAFFYWQAGFAAEIGSMITRLQFIPAGLSSYAGRAGALFIFAGIILLTLIFGRIYCSMLCPLGILQDIAARITRRKGEHAPQHRRARPNRFAWRVGILILISLVLGCFSMISWLDPYSISARFFSAIIYPCVIEVRHILGISAQQYLWDVYPPQLLAIIILSFAIPLILALWRPRFYCNTLCPVGLILGLLSRWSPLSLRIDKSICKSCGSCTKTCKTNAINIKTQEIDSSRCIACYRCIGKCKRNAIHILPRKKATAEDSPSQKSSPMTATVAQVNCPSVQESRPSAAHTPCPKKQAEHQPRPVDKSRRALLGFGLCASIGSLIPSCKDSSARSNKLSAPIDLDPSKLGNNHADILLPPGASSIEQFLDRCTGCGLCISACPSKILRPSMSLYGWEGLMKPYMNEQAGAGICAYNCNACGEVCPEAAIQALSLERKKKLQIGLVAYKASDCIAWNESKECAKCISACPSGALKAKKVIIPELYLEQCRACHLCSSACPEGAISLIVENGRARPHFDWDKCVGCGICISACQDGALEEIELIVPELTEEKCIGCNACVIACPSKPKCALKVTARRVQIQLDEV